MPSNEYMDEYNAEVARLTKAGKFGPAADPAPSVHTTEPGGQVVATVTPPGVPPDEENAGATSPPAAKPAGRSDDK